MRIGYEIVAEALDRLVSFGWITANDEHTPRVCQTPNEHTPRVYQTDDKHIEGMEGREGRNITQTDGDATFEWFRTHYTGKLSGKPYAIYTEAMTNYSDYIGVFRSNTEAWLNMPKYKTGYAPSAKKYLRDGIWCHAPNPVATGSNDLNNLLDKWVKGKQHETQR